MATLEREEGDYTYWSDGAQRYAKGNSLGKAPGSLAKRHPKSDAFTPATAKIHGANGHIAKRVKREERRLVSLAALNEALVIHPDSDTTQEGLANLWAARIEQASGHDGPAVNAHEMIERVWSGERDKSQPTVATQVNITISPGVEVEQRHMMRQLMDVVEGEARDVGDGGDDDEG